MCIHLWAVLKSPMQWNRRTYGGLKAFSWVPETSCVHVTSNFYLCDHVSNVAFKHTGNWQQWHSSFFPPKNSPSSPHRCSVPAKQLKCRYWWIQGTQALRAPKQWGWVLVQGSFLEPSGIMAGRLYSLHTFNVWPINRTCSLFAIFSSTLNEPPISVSTSLCHTNTLTGSPIHLVWWDSAMLVQHDPMSASTWKILYGRNLVQHNSIYYSAISVWLWYLVSDKL